MSSLTEQFQSIVNLELIFSVKDLTAQITMQVRKECEDAFSGPNSKVERISLTLINSKKNNENFLVCRILLRINISVMFAK